MPELWLSLKFWHIFLFLTDTESYEVDTQCIFRENILMIICEKCTKRGISIYADWKCLFFCSLVSFFSSAQEVFNNDVFRLRFRHAERSQFQ